MSHFNGEALKILRKEKNLTQNQLAETFYYTNLTIFNWEHGIKQPSFDTVVELALYFGVPLETFVK